MADPIKRIPFNINGRLALGDVFRYYGNLVFVTHQFGFLRANADTGEVRVRVGIGYQNAIFPPSDIGHWIVGDFNQSVGQMAVSEDWIVTDNLAACDVRPTPAALVWRNDASLSFHGFVPRQTGFWWNRGGEPVITGDEVYVPNDRGHFDVFNCATLKWVRTAQMGIADTSPTSVKGFTYRWVPLDGSEQHSYELVRADVATEPAPPPVPQPPIVEEPPMPPTPDVTEPCPPGTFRNPMTGHCDPIGPGTTVPPPVVTNPPVMGAELVLGGGRFRVTCRYGEGSGSPAVAVRLTELAGYFTFFSADNIEVTVKYADLTPLGPGNPRRFMFSAMTDVAFTLKIRDTAAGTERVFNNPQGTLLGQILDFPA